MLILYLSIINQISNFKLYTIYIYYIMYIGVYSVSGLYSASVSSVLRISRLSQPRALLVDQYASSSWLKSSRHRFSRSSHPRSSF